MKNSEIRYLIQQSSFKHYQIAEEIGITEETFCRWLHVRLNDERKLKILTAIEKLRKKQSSEVDKLLEEEITKTKKRGKKNE